MNIQAWMLAAFAGISQVQAAYTTISRRDATKAEGIINQARRNVNPPPLAMPKVSWDFKLQSALENARNSYGSEWFFEKGPGKVRYNGEILMDLYPFNVTFPKHGHLTHDGCENVPNAISRNFEQRAIYQANCFEYSNCNTTYFDNTPGNINGFISCSRQQPPQLVSGKSCSWSWQYYPMIVKQDVQTVACVLTGGPSGQQRRPNSFFCYYGTVAQQKNAQPYEAVTNRKAVCSECPPPSKCRDRLCV